MEKQIDYKAILDLFTTHERLRYTLGDPFHSDGVIAATDGRIACIVPPDVVSLLPNPPRGKYPVVQKVYPTDAVDPIEIPTASLFSHRAAEDLRNHRNCSFCDSDGDHFCSCGDEHTCDNCDGRGYFGPPDPEASLKGKLFRYGYIYTIYKAAMMANEDVVLYRDYGEHRVSGFDFGKMRCVVMPLKESRKGTAIAELLEKAGMTETLDAKTSG